MFRNLHGECQKYPFYPLNPDFNWTPAAKSWRARTRKLAEEPGLDNAIIAEGLARHRMVSLSLKEIGISKQTYL
jgi:hypothetical protein